METHAYQYGSDPKHVVFLTENQARASNEATFIPAPNGTHGTLFLPDGLTVEDLNSSAAILNQYIAEHGGVIPCTQEYLNDNPILKRI